MSGVNPNIQIFGDVYHGMEFVRTSPCRFAMRKTVRTGSAANGSEKAPMDKEVDEVRKIRHS